MGTYEVTTDGGTYQIETEEPSSFGQKAANIGMGALETVNAPFQVAGEAIRGASESEPLRLATKEDPRGFRAPSIAQRLIPSLQTQKPPADPFQKAYQGLEGLVQPNLQQGSDVVTGEPDVASQIGGFGMALGMMPPKAGVAKEVQGEMTGGSLKPDLPVKPPSQTGPAHALFDYNDPITGKPSYQIHGDPALTGIKTTGNVPLEQLGDIPVTGKTAKAAQLGHEPPPLGADKPPVGETPKPGDDPLKEVTDYVTQKYGQAAAKPGMVENLGKFMQKTSQQLGAKDLGIQPRQVQSMGPGFQGIEKAEALVDYAREKGYFSPTLTDIAREAKIKDALKTSGQNVESFRSLGDQRGVPPVADIANQVKTQLERDYGVDAPREIKKVLMKIDKAPPTFSGMADLATELNKAKTNMKSLGQHPGPTTDAANIVSRINNDALRSVLNPKEAQTYTESLRDFGAHKKLEQAVSASERRGLSARSNQRGILGRLFQEALDRGGYRVAGNISHGMGKAIGANPSGFKTLPQFFEELAHQTGDVLDETMGGMAHGGIVPEVGDFLEKKYGKKQ